MGNRKLRPGDSKQLPGDVRGIVPRSAVESMTHPSHVITHAESSLFGRASRQSVR